MAEVKAFELFWNKGDIIRNIRTGRPYMVIHIYTRSAVIVVDLMEKATPNTLQVILPKDFSEFTFDTNMKMTPTDTEEDQSEEWEFNPLSL